VGEVLDGFALGLAPRAGSEKKQFFFLKMGFLGCLGFGGLGLVCAWVGPRGRLRKTGVLGFVRFFRGWRSWFGEVLDGFGLGLAPKAGSEKQGV